MFHCSFWSLAAQNVSLYLLVPGGIISYKHATPPGSILLFGPWRHKMFHCTLLAPGGTKCFIAPFGPWRHKCPLIPLAPDGSNPINMRPLQGRFSQYPDPGGVTCLLLFGPWRDKMFHCTFWSLAVQNVPLYHLVPGGTKCFIIPFSPWRDKIL